MTDKKKYLTCLFFVILFGAYLLKKDSADGRLLIWRCTYEMIKEHPFMGWGTGAFAAHYMDYQAAYLRTNPQSRFLLLADNVTHPFNEYLHVCLIGGIPLLLLLAGICLFLFYCYRRNPSWNGKAALLSLLSIGLFSFFSYPFSYPFTWIAVIFSCFVLFRQARFRIRVSNRTRKIGAICLACLSLCLLYNQTNRIIAEWKWKKISDKALSGEGIKVFPIYEQLKPQLENNPFFLYNYAAELYMAEQYKQSLSILKTGRSYWADYDLEMLFGETYLHLEQPEKAIAHFQTAADMCPAKFTPLYKLQLTYAKMENRVKAHELALRIVKKKIKIPSIEITHMKTQMKIELSAQHH